MSTADRQCPLCEQRSAAPFCSTHGLPTLDSAFFAIAPRQASPGLILGGRYRLGRVLGSGAIGTVYSAEQITTGREVAIKVLHPQHITRHNLRRFFQEGRVISRLVHPNVVQLVDFGVDDSTRIPFLVMELAAGETFGAFVEREGALAEKRAAAILVQLARALVEAHALGIVHRDLKPENLMITRLRDGEEHLKVLDFGLAKLAAGEGGEPLTRPGVVIGSPLFMSPEQARGEPVGDRTDLYALGALLFFSLTGHPPFFGTHVLDVLEAQISAPVPRLPELLVSGLPPSQNAADLIDRLLAKAADDRLDAVIASRVLGAMARAEVDPELQTLISVPKKLLIANAPTALNSGRYQEQALLLYAETLDPQTPETPQTPIDPPKPPLDEPITTSTEPRMQVNLPVSIEVNRPKRWPLWIAASLGLMLLILWITTRSPAPAVVAEPLPPMPRAVVAPDPPLPVEAEPESVAPEPEPEPEPVRKPAKQRRPLKEKTRSIPVW